MAKIIVTKLDGERALVDTNSKFETCTRSGCVLVTTGRDVVKDLYLNPIKESLEEVQKFINEVEAEATNAKLDLILENQRKILEALRIK